MSIVSALVLLAIIWFVALFVILPIGVTTQSDQGNVTKGTPSSAPVKARMRQKFMYTSLIAIFLWGCACAIILSGLVTLDDVDLHKHLRGTSAQPYAQNK